MLHTTVYNKYVNDNFAFIVIVVDIIAAILLSVTKIRKADAFDIISCFDTTYDILGEYNA